MRGWSRPIERATSADPRDPRVPPIFARRLTSNEVHAITRPGATDPRFRSADRWLERWGATHGVGDVLPLIATLKTPSGPSVPLLDDRESLLIDEAVRLSSDWARTFVMLWYRSLCSVQQIADELKIRRRRAVYEERDVVLAYYLGRFTEIGLPLTFWVESG